MSSHSKIKIALYNECLSIAEKRIAEIETRLASIRESRNNETKSSVGDKYETGRAMMQIEEDNAKLQLANAREVKTRLSIIDAEKVCQKGESGSLVSTDSGIYFLSIGLGKIMLGNKPYYCISTNSPIGKLLINKKVGDTIVFNQKAFRITGIC